MTSLVRKLVEPMKYALNCLHSFNYNKSLCVVYMIYFTFCLLHCESSYSSFGPKSPHLELNFWKGIRVLLCRAVSVMSDSNDGRE